MSDRRPIEERLWDRADKSCGMGGSKLDRISAECLHAVAALDVFPHTMLAKWWGISRSQAGRIARQECWP